VILPGDRKSDRSAGNWIPIDHSRLDAKTSSRGSGDLCSYHDHSLSFVPLKRKIWLLRPNFVVRGIQSRRLLQMWKSVAERKSRPHSVRILENPIRFSELTEAPRKLRNPLDFSHFEKKELMFISFVSIFGDIQNVFHAAGFKCDSVFLKKSKSIQSEKTGSPALPGAFRDRILIKRTWKYQKAVCSIYSPLVLIHNWSLRNHFRKIWIIVARLTLRKTRLMASRSSCLVSND
jgi:hypothetical protein